MVDFIDTEGYTLFMHQMIKDALQPDEHIKTSTSALAKREAIAFFKAENSEMAAWRDYIMDVALDWPDYEQRRLVILELIENKVPWFEVRKFAMGSTKKPKAKKTHNIVNTDKQKE